MSTELILSSGWIGALAVIAGGVNSFFGGKSASTFSKGLRGLGWLGACGLPPALIAMLAGTLAFPEYDWDLIKFFPLLWISALGGLSCAAVAFVVTGSQFGDLEFLAYLALCGVQTLILLRMFLKNWDGFEAPWQSGTGRQFGLLVFMNAMLVLPVLLGVVLED